MENTQKNNLAVPIAIVIAGALIAGAMIFSNNDDDSTNVQAQVGTNQKEVQLDASQKQQAVSLDAVAPISNEDHMRGNPDAQVKIVEYSDFECPFCKRFHNTMNQIMDEYGADCKVAWVYRQAPIEELHPVQAMKEAVASECAAELGGNDAFWAYANRFFELTPSNNRTDLAILPQIAEEIGLDRAAFEQCLESDKYDDHIAQDLQNSAATGGRGTPWSILIAPNGEKYPINGAQPYATVKQLVELALKQ